MRVLRLGQGDRLFAPSAVCLGFFDGVHIGHAQLIRRAQAIGQAEGLLTCVHTFDEMPARVINPYDQTLELTPLAEKLAVFSSMGVDVTAISRFRTAIRMPAEAFFHEVLVGRLCARHIVAGFHHRFGFRGQGDVPLLKALCEAEGIGLDIIEPVRLADGELVSSTAIRAAIAAGDTQKASRMLGRPVLGTHTDIQGPSLFR